MILISSEITKKQRVTERYSQSKQKFDSCKINNASTLWRKRSASFDIKFSSSEIFSVKLHRIPFKFVLVE